MFPDACKIWTVEIPLQNFVNGIAIEQLAAARGIDNLQVVTADMNDFGTDRTFDRVVSVEMFEHMRNWEALLARIRDWLAPGGALFVHVFCMREVPYFFEVDGRSDWLARHFFTGGLMVARSPERLREVEAKAKELAVLKMRTDLEPQKAPKRVRNKA